MTPPGPSIYRRSQKPPPPLFAVLLGLAVATASLAAAAFAQEYAEYEVKAAFLLNFTKFVDWPDTDLPPDRPFKIGILGEDPFGGYLDDALRDKFVQERPIRVSRATTVEDVIECDLVFVAKSEEDGLDEILKRLREHSILTVSDAEGFIEKGGMIYLERESRRITFSVNFDAAQDCGLKVSAKLLQLAKEVKHSSPHRSRRASDEEKSQERHRD